MQYLIGCLAENSVGLCFLWSVSCDEINQRPEDEKLFAVGKSGPEATFYFFLGSVGLGLGSSPVS